jgi:DNA modification methylase
MPFIDPNEIIIKNRYRTELDVDQMISEMQVMGGQLAPILVERKGEEVHLLDGERRTRACQKLGREVWYTTSEEGKLNVSNELDRRRIELMSNIARKDFTTVEKALLIEEVDRLMKEEFGQRRPGKPSPYLADTDRQGWSYAETAKLLGMKSSSSVQDAVVVAKAAQSVPSVKDAKTISEAKRIITRKVQEEARAELIRRGEDIIKVTDDSFDPRKFYSEKIMLGDCLEGMKKLPNGIVDYFVTDPPFGLDMDIVPTKNPELTKRALGTYEDGIVDIYALLSNVISEIARVGKPNCWIFMMCSAEGWFHLKEEFIKAKFQVCQKPLIWEKVSQEGKIAPGICQSMEFWPASCYETILMARRGSNQLAQQGKPDILRHQVVSPSIKRHFVERPVSLLEDLISRIHHAGTNAILCDPFVGSGSTLVAASHFPGIQAFGYELNTDFREKAIDFLVEEYLAQHGVTAADALL